MFSGAEKGSPGFTLVPLWVSNNPLFLFVFSDIIHYFPAFILFADRQVLGCSGEALIFFIFFFAPSGLKAKATKTIPVLPETPVKECFVFQR